YSLFRVDIPAQTVHSPGTNVGGLQDITLLELVGRHWSEIDVGGGFGIIVPSATNDALGQGKLQLAPAFGMIVTSVPRARLGLLLRNYFSVAGEASQPDLDYMSAQPLLAFRPLPTFFFTSDGVIQFDWKNGGDPTIPVNLRVGYDFSDRLALSAGPEWVIIGSGQNNINVSLRIDYQDW